MMRTSKIFAFLLTLLLLGGCQVSTAQSINELLREAEAAYQAGNFSQAETIIRRAIRTDPNNATAYIYLGVALRQQGKVDEAIAAYRRAIELNPYEATAYYNLGNALSEQNKLDEAIDAYRQAIELDPSNADTYSNLADVLTEKKQLDEAIAAYRQAVELDPNNAIRYYNLGDALRQQNQLAEAIDAYQMAYQIDPKPLFKQKLEITKADKQRIDKAIAPSLRAVELDPNNAVPYANLGDAYQKEQQLDEAIANYRIAIQIDPNFARPYVGLGDALRQQNKLDEAIAAYRQAIQIDPNNARAYIGLGNALRDKKELDKAVDEYRKGIKIDPNNSNAYYNLGLALSSQNKLDEAIAAYRQALNLPDIPGVPASTHTLAHNALGLALKEQGKLDEAIAEYKKGQDLDPYFVSSQVNEGEAKKQKKPSVSLHDLTYLPADDPWTSIRRSVVKVIAQGEYGTGWVIKREGDIAWIVTNRHVVVDEFYQPKAKNIQLEIYMGNLPDQVSPPQVPGQIVHIEKSLDIALLRATGLPPDIKPFSVTQRGIYDGTKILVVGHSIIPVVEHSQIRFVQHDWLVQHCEVSLSRIRSLTIAEGDLTPGSSGSPLVLKEGDKNVVVGIVFQITTPQQMKQISEELKLPVTRIEGRGVAYPITLVMQKLKTQGLI